MAKKKNKINGNGNTLTIGSKTRNPSISSSTASSLEVPRCKEVSSTNGKDIFKQPRLRKSNGSAKTTQTKLSDNSAGSAFAISRNKHWRYISAFHGPWLQLPLEILETLAQSNFLSPRPRSTDPAVLYDLIKIRKLVDEASDLAVRAQNGTASSALVGVDSGLPGGAWGLSYRGVGGNAKLSAERKYRMRELATNRLSQAYRLDEVAASVATMQGSSALDNVAHLVLQRNPNSVDAKYVHFFHEKIPSRMMSDCTPLTPLNEIIGMEPGHAAPFRTRALTRIFKDDTIGAIKDLTESLALFRLVAAKHKVDRNQLVTTQASTDETERRKAWAKECRHENRVMDEDQPSGMEMQLLFQRGNQYLTLACRNVRAAMEDFRRARTEQATMKEQTDDTRPDDHVDNTAVGADAYRRALEAREIVRKNAKRALRDYTLFLSKLDYAHTPIKNSGSDVDNRASPSDGLADQGSFGFTTSSAKANTAGSSTLLRRPFDDNKDCQHRGSSKPTCMNVHQVSALLSTSAPTSIPAFPRLNTKFAESNQEEILTYHPLLPETLHALLLTHCLLQTPTTALHRHANNVARLIRLADGYPLFLTARSPARADWSEILRKTRNWIGLSNPWESLCKVSTPVEQQHHTPEVSRANPHSPGGQKSAENPSRAQTSQQRHRCDAIAVKALAESRHEATYQGETVSHRRDRIHKEAIMEALSDERVVDDETFQRAVEAREKRAWRDIVEAAQSQLTSSPMVLACTTNGNPTLFSPPLNETELRRTHALYSHNSAEAVVDLQGAQTMSRSPDTSTAGSGASRDCKPDALRDSRVIMTNPTTNFRIGDDKASTSNGDCSTYEPPCLPLGFSGTNGLAKLKGGDLKATTNDEEYPIGTERAEAIARWVLEAPTNVVGNGLGGKSKRGRARKKG